MDVHCAASSAARSERTSDMADLRKCIGSARFGIEAHNAPVEDFPSQPSQKDGLGRMCKTHWNQYTAGLARDAKARKAAEGDAAVPAAEVNVSDAAEAATAGQAAKRTRRAKRPAPSAEVQEGGG
jgi:hypothetical protein